MKEENLITVNEIAAYLQINKFTVYRLVAKKILPAFRVGGQWRFKRELIEKWLAKRLNTKLALLLLAFLMGCAFISPPSEEETHIFVLQKTEGRRIFWSGLSRNFINNVTTGYVYVVCGPNKKFWVYVRASVWEFQIEPREKCPDKIYEENI